jgi:hypothetical protein
MITVVLANLLDYRRAQQLYGSRKAEMEEMLAAVTSRQEEMQTVAQEKAQMQGVIDMCKANIQVRRSPAHACCITCLCSLYGALE